MPVIKLADDSGSTLRLLDVDGYYVPTCDVLENHEQRFRSMPTWQARDDDIVICAYPKSGMHGL